MRNEMKKMIVAILMVLMLVVVGCGGSNSHSQIFEKQCSGEITDMLAWHRSSPDVPVYLYWPPQQCNDTYINVSWVDGTFGGEGAFLDTRYWPQMKERGWGCANTTDPRGLTFDIMWHDKGLPCIE